MYNSITELQRFLNRWGWIGKEEDIASRIVRRSVTSLTSSSKILASSSGLENARRDVFPVFDVPPFPAGSGKST